MWLETSKYTDKFRYILRVTIDLITFFLFSSFDMYDETNIKLLRDKSSECKQPCDCGEVKEVSIRFREFTRITNFTFYGCCGENNLIVRIMSKIFPDNAATLPLRQFPGKNFHSADLMSITTNELLVSHKLNNTFRICDVLVFGQSVASIANVRFVF